MIGPVVAIESGHRLADLAQLLSAATVGVQDRIEHEDLSEVLESTGVDDDRIPLDESTKGGSVRAGHHPP